MWIQNDEKKEDYNSELTKATQVLIDKVKYLTVNVFSKWNLVTHSHMGKTCILSDKFRTASLTQLQLVQFLLNELATRIQEIHTNGINVLLSYYVKFSFGS